MFSKNQIKLAALGMMMLTTSFSALADHRDPPCGAGVNCPPGYVRPGEPNRPGFPPGGHFPGGPGLPPGHVHGPGCGHAGFPVDPNPYQPGYPGRVCQDWDRDGICNRWDPYPTIPGNPYNPPPYYPPPPPPPPAPYPPPYPPPYPGPGIAERRDIFVNRYLRDENMDLLTLAGLSIWADRGTVVESVEVLGRDGGYSMLMLLSDGIQVAQDSFPGSISTMFPNRTVQVGVTTNRLELGVRGKLFVDRVTLTIRRQGTNPGQGVNLERQMFQNFFSGQRLDLTSLFSLYQYSGYRIASLTIEGVSTSPWGNSTAQFMINGGFAGSANFSRYTTSQTILPSVSAIIGVGFNDLQILVDGDMQITRVRVNLVRY